MKVLHVLGAVYPERGGPAKVAPELCRALVNKGIDARIYTTNMNIIGSLNVPLGQAVNEKGVKTYYFPISLSRRYAFSRQLAQALRLNISTFDICHIHSLYMFHTSAAAYYCRRNRIPYLIRPHGTLDPFLRRKSSVKKFFYNLLFEKRNLDLAAAIHYTSQEEMQLAHQALKIKSPGIVVPLGLNLDEYANLPARGTFRSLYPELHGKFIFLFLGRLDYKKGLDLLSKAYAEIARTRTDVHLVIAGPDETGYTDQVKDWLAREGVLNRATFTGMLHEQEKLAAFCDADAFVLPSYTENFGIALVEALACGSAVLTTNKVNIWREIEAADAGVITNCDPGEIQSAMMLLMADPNLRERLRKNARQLAAKKYSWDTNVTLMIDNYEKILGN